VFQQKSENGYITPIKGIRMKTLVHGEKTLMAEFRLDRGSLLPAHAHPHEQTGYLVSGKMRLRVGTVEQVIEPGDSWMIPGGTEHGADILENSVAVEVFAPVREDYLPADDD
jgi:quercetin dioxygenase-like cupin family protein